jgi:uncharacterized protein
MEIFSVSWFLAFSAVIFAAFVRGISGFGMSLVLAPIMLLIINSKSVVVLNLLLGMVSNFMVLSYSLKHLEFKAIFPLCICYLLGMPIGLWTLKSIDVSILKVLIGAITIIFAIPLMFRFSKAFKNEKMAGGIAGFFSGLIGTATSLGGPPVVLFMHNQDWVKERIHADLALYFAITAPTSIIALALTGLMDKNTVLTSASFIPALFIGIFLGMLAFKRINPRVFRNVSLAIIIGAGILGIISGLGFLS